MILITSLGEFHFIILQSFFLSFISLLKKKKKKRSAARLFSLGFPAFAVRIHFQWIKNSKASSSGFVGKLTERKWYPHMKSNTVTRVTLGHI